MGLTKVHEEVEFFPGVMRPEKHVVSGITLKQKPIPHVLYFVASSDISTDDITIIHRMIGNEPVLVSYMDHKVFVYRVLTSGELSTNDIYILDELKDKLKWFDWRVF